MSKDYYIGLSKEQITKLLLGDEVGKRPYDIEAAYNGELRYNGTIRIHVRLLSENDRKQELDSAFEF